VLSKSGRLHCQTVPRDQERPHVRQYREQSRNHHSDANRFGMSPKLLIREAAGRFDDRQHRFASGSGRTDYATAVLISLVEYSGRLGDSGLATVGNSGSDVSPICCFQ